MLSWPHKVAADLSAPLRSARPRRPAGRPLSYLLLFAIGVLGANALFGESGLLAARTASREQAHLAERIAAVEAENEALREQARRLREDPSFIEEVARRELGLIRPGERVFILHPTPEETDTAAPDPGQ